MARSDQRDKFVVEQEWAVRVADLQGSLLRHRPAIVHFSGHGSQAGEIILEDQAGHGQPGLTPVALKRLLRHPQGQYPLRGLERLLFRAAGSRGSPTRSSA